MCFFGHRWDETHRFLRQVRFQGHLIPETIIEMTCRRCGTKEFIEKFANLMPSAVDETLARMERQFDEG